MFLEALLARNPSLIQGALALHRQGTLPPGTFCVDLEAVRENAALLAGAAAEHRIRLFFMTKQLGRNPAIAQAVLPYIDSAVVVDMDDADCLAPAGIPIGHAGHLVQPPRGAIPRLLSYRPGFVTVFSVEKALEVAVAAASQGRTQALLVRVVDDGDEFFPGQEGGVPLGELESAWSALADATDVRPAGVTSYPTAKFVDGRYVPTPNLKTLQRAVELLGGVEEVNAAGHTSVEVLPTIAAAGVTQAEPGHALTGTTPSAAGGGSPETPAVCFLTEVSHLDDDYVHVFGGGFYERGQARAGIVARPSGDYERLPLVPLPPSAIDYYRRTERTVDGIEVGDPMVFAFRFQVFTSRARVAVLDGVQSGKPELLGVWDSYGRPAVGTTKAAPAGTLDPTRV